MIKIRFILVILLLFGLAINGSIFSIKGSGNIIKEQREIDSVFNGIKLATHGDLYVKIGNKVKLTVEGDDNIIPLIVTKVSDNTLIIRIKRELKSGFSSRRGIRYYLTVKEGQLNYLSLTSHGDIKLPSMTGESVKLNLSSHGDIEIKKVQAKDINLVLTSHGKVVMDYLKADFIKAKLTSHGKVRIKSGEVTDQDVLLTSHGDYQAKGLCSENCKVVSNSHGKIVIYATKKLNARISGHSRLYYKGNPVSELNSHSHGRIVSID